MLLYHNFVRFLASLCPIIVNFIKFSIQTFSPMLTQKTHASIGFLFSMLTHVKGDLIKLIDVGLVEGSVDY